MAAAILLLLIGYDIFQRKNFQKTEGQVVTVGWQGDLQTENQEEYIMVRYMADGVSYVEKQQILSRIFYREGQKVTVYYDKKDPHRTWNRLRLICCLYTFRKACYSHGLTYPAEIFIRQCQLELGSDFRIFVIQDILACFH